MQALRRQVVGVVLAFPGLFGPMDQGGVQAVAQRLRRDGHDVELHLYDGLRHEVHNEPESRADVESSLVTFVDRVAKRN
mgnify:CR=1 FL=1